MTKTQGHSELQMALRSFRKNRLAMVCVWILGLLYFSVIFAGFFSPYSYRSEMRDYSFHPPTRVYITDEKGLSRPYIYRLDISYDEYQNRVYREDRTEKYYIDFFHRGDEYRLLGLIPSSFHLFGVEEPSRIYLLGADSRGRDIFSRILYGGRISLSIGLIGVAITFSIGLLIGGISGYYGGRVDNVLMRICEMMMLVPGFYLLLALIAALPAGFNSVQTYFAIILILSFIGWAGLARVIRGMCLSLREREYVLAAKTLGLSDLQIIVRHILPHTLSYSIFVIMLSIPGYIIAESGLSMIGLGIQDPFASWGNMLADAMNIIRLNFYPWILWPGFFIFLTVICFNVIGNTLRDCLDPMLKSEGGW